MTSQPDFATATLVNLEDCFPDNLSTHIGLSSYFRGTVEAYISRFEEADDLTIDSTPAKFLSYMSEIFTAPVVQEWATFLDKELDWHNNDDDPAVSDLIVYNQGAQARYTLSRILQQFGEPEITGDCFYEHASGQYACADCKSDEPLWADPLPRVPIPNLDCLAVPTSELEWFEEANHRVNKAIASSLFAVPPSANLPQLRTADNRLFVVPESRDNDTVYLYYASRESRFTHKSAQDFPISRGFKPLSPSMTTFYCTTSPVAGLRHLKANRPKLLFSSSRAGIEDDPAALLVFKVSLGQLLGREDISSEGGERFKVKDWVEEPNDELLFDVRFL